MDALQGNSLLRLIQYAVRHSAFLIITLLVLSAFYGFNVLKTSNYFPIQTVRVVGVNRLDKAEVRETLDSLVNRGFFSIDVERIRDRLEQLPWVSSTAVRRVWPDGIEVILKEKEVLARWNKESLLSTDGDLFTPRASSYPESVAEFSGPDGQQINMLKYFININRILQPLHAKISYLELTPYLTWMLRLDNGLVLKMGHNDVLTRMAHFVKVFPKIVGERAADVDYIDLRYSNGMAIKWKNAG